MGTTMMSIVIAVLAGIGTYYTWEGNKGLSLILAVVTLVSGIVGTIGAFIASLRLIFKLIPLVILVLGVWLVISTLRRIVEKPSK